MKKYIYMYRQVAPAVRVVLIRELLITPLEGFCTINFAFHCNKLLINMKLTRTVCLKFTL